MTIRTSSNKDPSVTVDRDLLIRPQADALLVEWRTTCDFHGTTVYRHICEGIDRPTARSWLEILAQNGVSNSTYGGLRLQKTNLLTKLTFTRTFLYPEDFILSPAAESNMEKLLEAFVRGDS